MELRVLLGESIGSKRFETFEIWTVEIGQTDFVRQVENWISGRRAGGLDDPMCTLIALYRNVPGRWLVVAANRDEYRDRPSEEPAVRTGRDIPWLAPMDIRAGGTWLGLSRKGVFAALTNLRDPNPDPARQSRGHVVADCLQMHSAAEAADGLMAIKPGTHNPFNAFVADREGAYLVTYRGEPRLQSLEAGVHVVGNIEPRKRPSPEVSLSKVDRVRDHAERIAGLPESEVVDGLADLCRAHSPESSPLDDVCVHAGDSYGTRSSVLIELPEPSFVARSTTDEQPIGGSEYRASGAGSGEVQVERGRFLYAAGPPCIAPFEDISFLLDELRQTPDYTPAEHA